VYVLTGDNNIGEITIWRYDEPNDDWIVVTSASTGGNPICYSNAFFSVIDKLYVHASQNVDNFRSYDPATDTWEILVDADAYGECITFGFSIGDKGYLLFSAQEVADVLREELWEYDPSNETWTQRPDYPGYTDETFDYPETMFVIDNMAYVGMTSLESGFHRFDQAQNTWETIQQCGYRGSKAAGFVIDGLGYVAGGSALDPGSGGNILVNDVWRLDPENLSIVDKSETSLTVYPNPVGDVLLIQGIQDEVTFSIYSLLGKLVAEGISENRTVDTGKLPQGMFLITITSEEKTTVKKLLKL
jgi:N-acetylneuraminic acid mutarotase